MYQLSDPSLLVNTLGTYLILATVPLYVLRSRRAERASLVVGFKVVIRYGCVVRWYPLPLPPRAKEGLELSCINLIAKSIPEAPDANRSIAVRHRHHPFNPRIKFDAVRRRCVSSSSLPPCSSPVSVPASAAWSTNSRSAAAAARIECCPRSRDGATKIKNVDDTVRRGCRAEQREQGRPVDIEKRSTEARGLPGEDRFPRPCLRRTAQC